MNGRPIFIWDANPFNPYGTEIARVISNVPGVRVTQYTRSSKEYSAKEVRTRAILPPPQAGQRKLSVVCRYFYALTLFFMSSLIFRPVLVFPWLSNQWETGMVRFLQLCGLRTVIIVHNPVPERDDVDLIPFLRKARKGATKLVVHSESLQVILGDNSCVAAHPAYFSWRDSMAEERFESSSEPSVLVEDDQSAPAVAYIGTVRSDKGFIDLPIIAEALTARKLALKVCVGLYREEQMAVLRDIEGVIVIGGGKTYASDQQIYEVLKSSSVLIAPYSNVTASGTVLLALSMGMNVVAYESPELSGLLPRESFVKTGDTDALAEAAFALSSTDAKTVGMTVEGLDQRSQAQWGEILSSIR